MPLSETRRRAVKVALFLLCSLPLAQLVAAAAGLGGLDLGANPVESLIHQTGLWTLRLLLVTLLVTPAARVLPRLELPRLRRMLGLFAFSYALCHFLVYAVIDQGLALPFIIEDVTERPFITVGFTALLLLMPLAATSNRASMRRLGRRWKPLHGLVYPITLLGCWHFYWQVKADVREPLVYLGIWMLLMVARLPVSRRLLRPPGAMGQTSAQPGT
jgi:sulfoxide reductase heme-binding subunit YedZ